MARETSKHTHLNDGIDAFRHFCVRAAQRAHNSVLFLLCLCSALCLVKHLLILIFALLDGSSNDALTQQLMLLIGLKQRPALDEKSDATNKATSPPTVTAPNARTYLSEGSAHVAVHMVHKHLDCHCLCPCWVVWMCVWMWMCIVCVLFGVLVALVGFWRCGCQEIEEISLSHQQNITNKQTKKEREQKGIITCLACCCPLCCCWLSSSAATVSPSAASHAPAGHESKRMTRD